MSHRANLDASMARNSNRGIVTMSERNGLQSGTIRMRSGRRRSSAMSNRSYESLTGTSRGNQACNQYYDKNLGRAFDKYK